MKTALLIVALTLLAAPAAAQEKVRNYLEGISFCSGDDCPSWSDKNGNHYDGIDCDKDALGCLAHWHLDHDYPKTPDLVSESECIGLGHACDMWRDQKFAEERLHCSDDYFIVLKCHDDQCKPYRPSNPNQFIGGRYECAATCGEWPNAWCPDPKNGQCNAKDEPR